MSVPGNGPQSVVGPLGGTLPMRDYQRAAVNALLADWRGGLRRCAVVLPTGAGKTVCFAHLGRMLAEAGGRSLVLAHREELLTQAAQKFHDVAPGLRVGIARADQREIHGRDVVVASVASFRKKAQRAELARARFNLIIVDECHHVVAQSYMDILDDLGAFASPENVTAPVVAGFTATLARGDKASLGDVWQKVSYRLPIIDLIRRGYLCTARGVRVRIDGLDLRRVQRTAGDWQSRALGQAMSECMAPEAIARAVVEHAKDRQGIVFTPTVALAYECAEALTAAGVVARAVDGATPMDERRATLAAYRRGDVQAIVNCGVFTEGTDLPMTSLVVIARPTSSAPLYVQMAGRGLRPWPGKRDCLVMDVVGVTGKHRLASLVELAGGERVEALSAEEREELAELAEELDLDLLGMEERAGDLHGPAAVDGPLVSEEVDLFGQSHQVWLRTHRGVWFVMAGREVVCLVPAGGGSDGDGRWHVAAMPTHAAGGRWIARDCELSYAMSWGEQEVERIEATLPYRVDRGAAWRRRPATEKQLREAHRLGIVVPEGATAADVGDLISIEHASRRLDHLPMFTGVTR